MKMSAARYDELKTGIRAVVVLEGVENIRTAYQDKTAIRMMWDLFWRCADDWNYPDSHPIHRNRVHRNRVRIHAHKPEWDMYEGGLSDRHITTALLRIGEELGILP